VLKPSDILADWLPWLFPLRADVIATKAPGLLRVVRLELPDLETASHEALLAYHEQLEDALSRLGTGWSMWLDQWRRSAPGYLPENDFAGCHAAQKVDAQRRRHFEGKGAVFLNHAFMALHYVPQQRDAVLGFLLEKNISRVAATLEAFLEESDGLIGALRHILPRIEILEDTALATYLSATVSYNPANVRMPAAYLDAQLGGVEWHTDPAPCIDGLHLRTVEVHNYGPVSPLTAESLHELPFEARWCMSIHFLDGEAQRRDLEELRKRWLLKRKGLPALIADAITRNPDAGRARPDIDRALAELDDIQGDLSARPFALAHLNVHVWSQDQREAEGSALQVASFLNAQGLRARIATLNSIFAPIGDVPGNVGRDVINIRRPRVPLAALTRLAPVTGVSVGSRQDERLGGPALLVAETRRSVPLYWSLHVPGSDVGHTAVIGRSGAGKSTLLAFMALQFLKYQGASVVVFDRRASFMVPCLCAGGDWLELGGGKIGVQPLRAIDQPAERAWAHGWISRALRLRGLEATPQRDQAVNAALEHVAALPTAERTLMALHTFLAGDSEVRTTLQHYLASGPYGPLFDGVVPAYGAAAVVGIETDEIIRLEDAAPLVITAVFRALQRERLTGDNPKLVVIDEAWSFFRHPLFAGEIESMARELRKLNAVLVLATQSLADLQGDTTRIILDQVANQVFLPDPEATRPQTKELYHRVGLSDEQIQLLTTARPKGEYLLQTQSLTRLAAIRLEDEARCICGASTPADHARARALLAAGVAPGQPFTEAWLAAS
jgi:type IV secretion system protein VirB4